MLGRGGWGISLIGGLRNVLYSIYGLADSDCDNKLSVILIHYFTVDLGGRQGGAKDH